MNKEQRFRGFLRFLTHYLIFFVIIAFVITCCITLFVSTLQKTVGILFTEEEIQRAAKLTFLNVLAFSAIFTLLDIIRRRFVVVRPIRKITDAVEKMSEGDFTVRIPKFRGMLEEDMFCEIAECINKMAEELSGVETLRADFVANVSHELKTPLAVIQNYSTMLQAPALAEEKRTEYAKAIFGACRRLSSLITNMLKLSKLENQHITPAVAEYDLGEQICECLLQFEEEWERKNIRIETEVEDGVRIRSDAELLSHVWNNLFSNALKFTGAGGRVFVGLKSQGDSVTVWVADTGCGMSAEVGAHIFDKFYQGDPSRATQGNGLGLALVRRVVELMHGEIEVESTVGKGSTFTVRLRRG